MSLHKVFVAVLVSSMLAFGFSGCGLFKKNRAADSGEDSRSPYPSAPSSNTGSSNSGPRTAPIILNEGTGANANIDPSTIDDRTLSGVDPKDLGKFVDPSNPLSKRIVYFAYDSDSIRPEYRAVVEAHARYLRDNPGAKVRLEGHADERGTREYNIALGERRAKSVQQTMLFGGAGASQLSTLSYGEERPVVRGTGDSSWQQNRRVEIVYHR